MGKSIRAKGKKEARTQLRRTIGEVAAQTALLSTQAKLKECIGSKTTSIDRIANLFNTKDDGAKVVIIDSSKEEEKKEENKEENAPTKEEIEEELYTDRTRVPGKRILKIANRHHKSTKQQRASKLVAKFVRQRRMKKSGQYYRPY